MSINIGFISTRFSGTDGVTLEASKWADVFAKSGHNCFWFAGRLDRDMTKSLLVPEAYFKYEKNQWINEQILGNKRRNPSVTQAIHELRSQLKLKLHEFINHFNIDLIIAENVLTIPMHVPLGLALTETVAETQMPTISHNHDFYWERVRFSVNAVNDYLRMAFPPNLPNIKHVVINSEAQEQLALRTGISSIIVPNVIDFDNPPSFDAQGARVFRESIGLQSDDRMILQPTRIIRRKGIEYAIELVKELKDPRNKLIVSHEAGDEGYEYAEWLKDYAREHDVDLRLVATKIADPWADNGNGNTGSSLWDVYPFADFITYPSLYEGFGNAFLEAIYFKKPILINRYATFVRDIEPLGFDITVMDGFLTKKTVEKIKSILQSPERREQMVNYNYKIAARHYSYSVLCNQLNAALRSFFGNSVVQLSRATQISENNVHLDIEPHLVMYQYLNN
ncbi:MAG: glycosyltransferase family 4 protein [Thermodesulfobacteriota bacterium]|nr:glycosyltransferase family 4 protein [Thermodesulfobacteriota bacterium]